MIKVKNVIPQKDFNLLVEFEDGKSSLIDVRFILDETGPVVGPLKNWEEFQKVHVVNGIITWKTGYDIDPEFLLELAS